MPQFQKGQSGNPAGRPPGSRNRATIMVQNLPPVAAPVMCLFGGRRDSLFVSPPK
jgi:hypothetical protein